MKNKKLTLYLPEEVISRAKAHAREEGISLSGMVADFLIKETAMYATNDDEISTIEDEFVPFCGVIGLPDPTDERELAALLREEKHR